MSRLVAMALLCVGIVGCNGDDNGKDAPQGPLVSGPALEHKQPDGPLLRLPAHAPPVVSGGRVMRWSDSSGSTTAMSV